MGGGSWVLKGQGEGILRAVHQGGEEVSLSGLRSLSERIFHTGLLAGELSWRGRKAQGQVTQRGLCICRKMCFHLPWGSRPGIDHRPKGLSKDIRTWQQRQIRLTVKSGIQAWIILAASQLASNHPFFLPPLNPFLTTREGFLRAPLPCWLPPYSWLQPPFWLTPSNLNLGLLLF